MRRFWGPVRFFAMHRHWEEFGPPVYVSVASALKLNKQTSSRGHEAGTPRPDDDPHGLGELLDLFGEGNIG